MKQKNWMLYFFCIGGIAALIAFPAQTQAAVREALALCGASVIPALFPFFVLTKFLITCRAPASLPSWAERLMRTCFGVSGNCLIALCMSFLGGYPVGTSTVVSLYESGAITKRDAEASLRFCNNSGPAFFVGVVGAVLGSVRLGLLLFLAHILAALLCGALLAQREGAAVTLRRLPRQEPVSLAKGFPDAVFASCMALLQICGLILFFSVVLAVLDALGLIAFLSSFSFGLSAAELRALLCGMLELSSGVLRLRGTAHAALLAAFFMGWGGLCVHLQAIALWQPLGLHPKGYFIAKLLHGLLSLLLLQTFLAPSLPAFLLLASVLTLCAFLTRLKKRAGSSRRYAI